MQSTKKFIFLGISLLSFILMWVIFPRTKDDFGMPIAINTSQLILPLIFLIAGIAFLIVFIVFLVRRY